MVTVGLDLVLIALITIGIDCDNPALRDVLPKGEPREYEETGTWHKDDR